MAFSLGFVTYTVSTLVSVIEEVAEEMFGEDDDSEVREGVDYSETPASEVFEQLGDDVTLSRNKPPTESVEPAFEEKAATSKPKPSKTIVKEKYEEQSVTEYFLKYTYQINDIPNSRLRNSFGRRPFNRSTAQTRSDASRRNSQNEQIKAESEKALRKKEFEKRVLFKRDGKSY
ncbi:MAG: hypothetical protein R2684_10890 [Pyrinomonadaceae bacterium]